MFFSLANDKNRITSVEVHRHVFLAEDNVLKGLKRQQNELAESFLI